MTSTSEKRVSFNKEVRGVPVKSIYDYTAKEIKACWYNTEELDKIAERCVKILHKYENGKTKNGLSYCIRGLEGHFVKGSISRQKAVRPAARKAVLDAQALQLKNDNGEIKDLAIAAAYQRITATCQMRAQLMGSLDQQAADVSESKEFTLGIPAPPSMKATPSPDVRVRRKTYGVIACKQRNARAA